MGRRKGVVAVLGAIVILLLMVVGCKPAPDHKSSQKERNYRYKIVLASGFADGKTDAYEFVTGANGVPLPCVKYTDSDGTQAIFCGTFKIESSVK